MKSINTKKKTIKKLLYLSLLCCIFCVAFNQTSSFANIKLRYESYRLIRTANRPYTFFQNEYILKNKLDTEGKTQEQIEREVLEYYFGFSYIFSSTTMAEEAGLIDSEYIPDFYTLGECRDEYPERYEQWMNDWILNNLIKEEVKGFACGYYSTIHEPTATFIDYNISHRIANMSEDEIEKILSGKINNPISSRMYDFDDEVIKTLTINQLRSYYKRSEIMYYLLDRNVGDLRQGVIDTINHGEEFDEQGYRIVMSIAKETEQIKEHVRNFLKWKPSIFNGDSLEDRITILEAEELVRVLIRTHLLGNPKINFDFHRFNNKRANRWSYFSIDLVKEKFRQNDEIISLGTKDLFRDIKYYDSQGETVDITKNMIITRLGNLFGIKDFKDIRRIVSFDDELVSSIDTLENDPYNITELQLKTLLDEVSKYFKLKALSQVTVRSNAIDLSITELRVPFLENPRQFISSNIANDDGYRADSFLKFYHDVVKSKKPITIGYFLDNHGEVNFDLWFIQELIKTNDNISVVLVGKSKYISNDVAYKALGNIFQHDALYYKHFPILHEELINNQQNEGGREPRFKIANFGSPLQGIDLRKDNPSLINLLDQIDIGIFKGMANFKSTQGLDLERYYLFMNKPHALAEALGFDHKYEPLMFAYIAPGDKVGMGVPDRNSEHRDSHKDTLIPVPPISLYHYMKLHPHWYD